MKRFWIFFGVGSLGLVVDGGITLALISCLNWPAMVGRLPAFLLATVVTYALNRRLTFPGQHGSWTKGWLLYVSTTMAGALLNYLAYSLVLLVPGNRVSIALLGVVAGSAAGLFFNYTLSLKVVFRRAVRAPQA